MWWMEWFIVCEREWHERGSRDKETGKTRENNNSNSSSSKMKPMSVIVRRCSKSTIFSYTSKNFAIHTRSLGLTRAPRKGWEIDGRNVGIICSNKCRAVHIVESFLTILLAVCVSFFWATNDTKRYQMSFVCASNVFVCWIRRFNNSEFSSFFFLFLISKIFTPSRRAHRCWCNGLCVRLSPIQFSVSLQKRRVWKHTHTQKAKFNRPESTLPTCHRISIFFIENMLQWHPLGTTNRYHFDDALIRNEFSNGVRRTYKQTRSRASSSNSSSMPLFSAIHQPAHTHHAFVLALSGSWWMVAPAKTISDFLFSFWFGFCVCVRERCSWRRKYRCGRIRMK